ncbi:type II secretion system protein GspG [Akkermansiaceae bacterium]|nr:type II secretion system protein GspG [Akkermansiaceae bacterium]MDB4708163.1 type II secretion system protein GspG [Akkermansiaceae bacterium]MDB4801683.1 type II secretion system protein GspG [Akkermansiaceae bacterium]
MRINRVNAVGLAVIFSLLFLSSCKDGKEAADTDTKNEENGNPSLESNAVDAFKEQVKSLELNETMQAVEAAEATAKENPSPMFESIFSLNDKLQELKIDDLPEDLKAATRTLQNMMGAMSGHIKKLPIPMDVFTKGKEAYTAWIGEKMAADPSFMENFGSSMKGWQMEMDKLGKTTEEQGDEVEEVYKKYEIPIDFPEEKALETTKKTEALEALQCISKLIHACDAFFEEYQALPMATTSAIDAEQVTDNRLMAPLLGLKVASDENPKLKTFFSWKAAKGTGNSAVGGLVRTETTASLVDPWGNFYRVVFNYDNDSILREPQATGRNEVIYDRRVLAYSLGPDGIAGGEGEKDNIYSWSVSRE